MKMSFTEIAQAFQNTQKILDQHSRIIQENSRLRQHNDYIVERYKDRVDELKFALLNCESEIIRLRNEKIASHNRMQEMQKTIDLLSIPPEKEETNILRKATNSLSESDFVS